MRSSFGCLVAIDLIVKANYELRRQFELQNILNLNFDESIDGINFCPLVHECAYMKKGRGTIFIFGNLCLNNLVIYILR